ncbi:MAG: FAD binding domain-containing protein, partial [Anaerolineae bacterium]|nr:FAD binding domain-containing protein [Anaerolineae bacterium]
LGGNLAHSDPASDPPTVVLACGGSIHVQGPQGARVIPIGDFFMDLYTTALEPGEIITGVELENHSAHQCAYVKLSHPASRYAVVGICVVLNMQGGTCHSAAIAVGGATNHPVRAHGAEQALTGTRLEEAALTAAAAAIQQDLPADMLMDDISYPAPYRRAMTAVYLRRAIQAALA